MLDRLDEFRNLAKGKGISIDMDAPLIFADEEKNNDRELIEDFLFYVKEAQSALEKMEKNN